MQVVAWQARTSALTPAGLVAAGALLPALLAQLRQCSDEQLQVLSVVATRDLLVVLGVNQALPWIDGARYCAPSPQAPNLWTPTHLEPLLPVDLLQSNLIERAGSSPVLLWHGPEQILSLAAAQTLTPQLLDWLAGQLA
ncbi:bpX5 domain-containing protein [Herbaspirillum huttiense]|uniref:MoxR-vWA-beta-propeller ternary system domain-containing protein n=2 Tax=Herbaspirillum huttiense TaxID=863372 RepID=A0AAJ2LUX3_9BURK|nr:MULTISPECIES: hypothetical protein [Herbaspirillum]MDR9836013.1 hypothetical protein [Herbaspirillum huttiense]UWE16031.1 hypothetical protein NY669_23595 [Herbaspirillum huttiense]